jgi:hypothetical protein
MMIGAVSLRPFPGQTVRPHQGRGRSSAFGRPLIIIKLSEIQVNRFGIIGGCDNLPNMQITKNASSYSYSYSSSFFPGSSDCCMT